MSTVNEKKELQELRRQIVSLTNKAYRMQLNESAFVINDRLHDKIDGSNIHNWLEDQLEFLLFEIDNRVVELMN